MWVATYLIPCLDSTLCCVKSWITWAVSAEGNFLLVLTTVSKKTQNETTVGTWLTKMGSWRLGDCSWISQFLGFFLIFVRIFSSNDGVLLLQGKVFLVSFRALLTDLHCIKATGYVKHYLLSRCIPSRPQLILMYVNAPSHNTSIISSWSKKLDNYFDLLPTVTGVTSHRCVHTRAD